MNIEFRKNAFNTATKGGVIGFIFGALSSLAASIVMAVSNADEFTIAVSCTAITTSSVATGAAIALTQQYREDDNKSSEIHHNTPQSIKFCIKA